MATASFHLPGAGTYPLQSFGGAVLTNVTVNTGVGGGGIALYDAVNGVTSSIAVIGANNAVGLAYNTKLNHGLTAVVTGAVDATITVSSSPIGAVAAGSQQSSGGTLPAYSFAVTAYGAKVDGQLVADGAMSSTVNTTTLACTTSNPFVPGDVGKSIQVKGAAPTGVTTLVATISTYIDSGHVTLSLAASTTITGAIVIWGTDDTVAVQNAVNAASTYAQTHTGYAEILVPIGICCIAGALSHANSGNAQITFPVAPVTGNCITLALKGIESANAIRHWLQTVPQLTGACLVSFGVYSSIGAQTTDINANGQSAMIGGPTGPNGYGTATFLFSNMNVVIDGVNLVTTQSSFGLGYGAAWLWGVDQTNLTNVGYGTTGVFNNGNGDFSGSGVNTLSSGASIGIGLPATSNQNNVTLRGVTCGGGYTYGLLATEHMDAQGCHIFYCWAGLCPVGSWQDGNATANTSSHKINFSQFGIEGCAKSVFILGTGAAGIGPYIRGNIDSEAGLAWGDNNSGVGLAAALGEIRLSGTTGGTLTLSGGTKLTIIDERSPNGPGTSWSLSVGVAFMNPQWRWANVILTGGTNVTALQEGTLRGGPSAPTMTNIYTQASGVLPSTTVRVPPGGWLEVVGTGSAPTATVVYD